MGLFDWLTGNDRVGSQSPDGSNVIYDRSIGGGAPQGGSGSFDIHGNSGGRAHQGYGDHTFSWDVNGQGFHSGQHWTNHGVPTGHPDRHTPPNSR